MKYFYPIFGLLLMFSCKSSYSLIEVNNEVGDRAIYRNHDLKLDIQQKYLSILYPNVKGKDIKLYNKGIGFDKLRVLGCEQLLYAEHFDKTRFGFIAESYTKQLSPKFLQQKLQSRQFDSIALLDSLENHLTYSKDFEKYQYLFEEKTRKHHDKFIRYIYWGRVPIDPTATTKTYRLGENYKAGEKRVISEMLDFVYRTTPITSLKESLDYIGYFRNNLKYNYARLYTELVELKASNSEKVNNYLTATMFSFLSLNKDILNEHKEVTKYPISIDSLIQDGDFYPINEIIDSLADESPLMIFNEAHHWPQCRYQLKRLLPKLKAKGFTSLFLEAINKYETSAINLGAPLNQKAGTYTSDPTFANLIRDAQKLGIQIYGYEFNGETPQEGESRGQARERIQAENIIKIITEKDILDTGKVLVYCGYSHAKEKVTTSVKSMATHLKEKLRINPITINQHYLIGIESELTAKLKTSKNKPYLLKSPKVESSGYDFMLWEDNPSYFTNDPAYVYQLGNHQQEISCKGMDLNENYFIEIENMDDASLRIPYFAKSYNPNIKDIYLPKGSWWIRVFNEAGGKVCTEKFKL